MNSLQRILEEAREQMKRDREESARQLKEREENFAKKEDEFRVQIEARDKWTFEAIQKIDDWKLKWKNDFDGLEQRLSHQVDVANEVDNPELETLLKDLIVQFRKMPDILDRTKEGLTPPSRIKAAG